MKIEEKIKNEFLYDKKLNFFKFLYFNFQYLKSKFKPRVSMLIGVLILLLKVF